MSAIKAREGLYGNFFVKERRATFLTPLYAENSPLYKLLTLLSVYLEFPPGMHGNKEYAYSPVLPGHVVKSD